MKETGLLIAGMFLGVCLLGLWDIASEVYLEVKRMLRRKQRR